ncbi:MAG: hypothetical protein HN981_04990 [Candidatus Pacebacteria bacterium]|jgi:glycine/serine hydroxymethyltransferase|nr:hypothetical protein [Candidatus Paceibacterota bacterium]MBT6921720.1 hypothetical protein [Candidatus Paceibacterota bacterium]
MKMKKIIDQIKKEEIRNREFLHLTANEAQMSKTARQFLGSKISERYYMGGGENGKVDLGPFTVLGFPSVKKLVREAEEATKQMLGAKHVNLNCLSGVHAMMCAILSTTDPGDVVMSVHHDHGGHFATKGIIERIGRGHVFAEYDFDSLSFDVEKIKQIFKESGAKAFYMDVSYYLNAHNLKEIRNALGKEAIIIYDASHTMGLIMGQQFQDPFTDGADVICANTHKTLPGPQKGMIAFKDKKIGKKANKIINSSLFSSTHLHHLISLSIAILEMKNFGEDYAKQVISNSRALGDELNNLGYELRMANTGSYSDNHQVHLLTEKIGFYKDLYDLLFDNKLAVNFDNLFDKGIFIRLGTQEITRRGMKEEEMKKIVYFIDQSFKGKDIAKEVMAFNKEFSRISFSFDS